jgi:hypothetical protein
MGNILMPDKMTLAEISKQQCWLDLTDKQRDLVTEFTRNGGDKVGAVHVAYRCRNRAAAQKRVYIIFSSQAVSACLALLQGNDPVVVFMADLTRATNNKHINPAQVAALRLRALVGGFIPGTQPTAEPAAAAADEGVQRFPIGSVIIQSGKKYKVIAQEIVE